MARGGQRPGAGRPAGSRNRRTSETLAKASAAGLLPHEFLCAVARGEVIDGHAPTFAERMTAAAAAAPYFAPRLAQIDATTDATVHVIRAEPLTPEERDAEWLEQFGKLH